MIPTQMAKGPSTRPRELALSGSVERPTEDRADGKTSTSQPGPGPSNWALKHRYEIAVIVGISAYIAYWSWYTVSRYYSLNANVYDLAAFAEYNWQFIHGPYVITTYWSLFSENGLVFVMFPVALSGSYPALLVWQTLALASSAYAIYGIAKTLIPSELVSAALGLSFLIYFPVAGVNWFDVHSEAFFVPLILWGYLFFLRAQFRAAYLLLSLAAISRFPLAAFLLAFSVLDLIAPTRITAPLDRSIARRRAYNCFLVAFSSFCLVAAYAYIHFSGSSVGVFVHVSSVQLQTSALMDRFITIGLFLGPFLFLPILSRRWAIFLLPFLGLVLFASDPYYIYPAVFFTQYPSIILPFLYLGTIDVLSGWYKRSSRSDLFLSEVLQQFSRLFNSTTQSRKAYASNTPGHGKLPWGRVRRPTLWAVLPIISITVVLALVFQPYGPLNSEAQDPYHPVRDTAVNWTVYNAEREAVSLIPADSGNVLVQNNLVDAFPRPIGNNGVLLVTANTLAYNYTYLFQHRWDAANIDYVLADTGSWNFASQAAPPYNLSMAQVITHLYSTRDYGLMAEAYGIILLGRGYSGPVLYYEPSSFTIPIDTLFTVQSSYRQPESITAMNVTNHSTVWFGPYKYFPAGLYDVTYELLTTNESASNQLELDVIGPSSLPDLASSVITGSDFSSTDTWTNVTVQAYINNFYPTLNFPANNVVWSGTLSLRGIKMTQVAPPSTIFTWDESPQAGEIYSLVQLLPATAAILVQPDLVGFVLNLNYTVTNTVAPSTRWPAQYILADTATSGFLTVGVPPFTASAYDFVSSAITNRTYGIVGELQGILLLKENFSGPPTLYEPYQVVFTAAELSVTSPTFRDGGLIRAVNSTSQTTVWFGPYIGLPPGNFTVTFMVESSTLLTTNYALLQILEGSSSFVASSLRITGANFSSVDTWMDITLDFVNTNVAFQVNLPGNDVYWVGTLALESISVTQSTP